MERCWGTGKQNIMTVMETSEVTFLEDVEIAYQILA
jgi:hypothetical protein